jgi:FMN phosphatase YigB (HAD superfamily)
MVKCVVFDLMGVIFSEGHIIRKILHPMLENRFSYDYVKKMYLEYTDGNLKNEDFWRKFFPKGSYKEFERKFLDSIQIDKDFYMVNKELKRRKLKLAVLSHLPKEWGIYLVRKNKIDKIFDVIVISGEYKIKKTDRQIYEILLKKLDQSASDCIFVDNDLSYLQTASKVGFKTVLMEKEEVRGEFKPDFLIKSLKELIQIINDESKQ